MNLSAELIMVGARGLALILALSTLAWAFIRWRRDTTRDTQRVFEQLDLVRAELLQLQDQMVNKPTTTPLASRHYAAPAQQTMQHEQRTEQRRVQQPITNQAPAATSRQKPNTMTNAAPRGYEVATRLARNGASCDELMNTCALSRHEAELLVRLHAGMKAQQPPRANNLAGSVNGNTANNKIAPHSNVNQLKNIGASANTHTPSKAFIKPVSTTPNKTTTSAKPAYQPRVSLVG